MLLAQTCIAYPFCFHFSVERAIYVVHLLFKVIVDISPECLLVSASLRETEYYLLEQIEVRKQILGWSLAFVMAFV